MFARQAKHLLVRTLPGFRNPQGRSRTSSSGTIDPLSLPIDFYYSDNYDIPLPKGHKYPMHKYKLIRKALEAEGFGSNTITRNSRISPAPLARREHVILAHSEKYIDRFLTGKLTDDEIRRIGFPWSLDLVFRSLSSTGGTIQAAMAAMQNKRIGCNLSGGTHHAFYDSGSGYCCINDIAVAARVLLHVGMVESKPGSIVVIDLDVHQGDGTASIFAEDDRVVTVSAHSKNNFPFRKQRSDYDIDLEDKTTDEQYMKSIEQAITNIVDKHKPSLIFYQAGVDPLAEDTLGRLSLTREGMRRRNKLVYHLGKTRGIPIAVCLGGGYSVPIDASVQSHVDVFRDAAEVFDFHQF